ncbi:MAG: cell division protein FtsW [Lachnospiraceae bacterium]|nr:cell division protein FtsW [Lachnospiraceae bacterium]
MSRKEKKEKKNYFDYTLLFLVLFMIAFGLVMLYSTSYHYAEAHFHDATFYLRKQGIATGIGLVLMFFTTMVPYNFWKKFAIPAYLLSCGLSIAVLIVSDKINGSARWLNIGGLSFQPAELAKIAVILFIARYICQAPKSMGRLKNMLKTVAWLLPISAIVALSNLSSAIIIFMVGMIIIFVASPKYIHFAVPAVLAAGVGGAFIIVQGYRMDRIKYWLHPELLEAGNQTVQGLYAIGAGGWFGKGLGESIQKMGSLPEAQNDMIFSIVCEELGVLGALGVILIFGLMLWRFMVIATNSKDLFGSLLVVGIMGHIALQVILNIAVVTNSIPNTGVTLPFISYGGTAICFLLAEMGLALSVSRGIILEEEQVMQ